MLRIVTIAAVISVSMTAAGAHEAPAGWNYDSSCCSNFDCRQVSDGTVKETAEGYQLPTGEVISYDDARIKPSKDEFFHWCTVAGANDSRTICLYVPPRSF